MLLLRYHMLQFQFESTHRMPHLNSFNLYGISINLDKMSERLNYRYDN